MRYCSVISIPARIHRTKVVAGLAWKAKPPMKNASETTVRMLNAAGSREVREKVIYEP